MANDRDFLGKGLRFPVSINLNGGVSTSAFEENVRQCIFIILGTAPGERINRPEFGCQIHDLMFAPNNQLTAAMAAVYCEEAIYKFEPRVEHVSCQARPNADETCSRLAIRRTPAERLAPAPWKRAGLKNAASPLASGSCTRWSSK